MLLRRNLEFIENFIDGCRSWGTDRKWVSTLKYLMSGNLQRYKQDKVSNKKLRQPHINHSRKLLTSPRPKRARVGIRGSEA